MTSLTRKYTLGKEIHVTAKENYLKKIWNAFKKMVVREEPLGRQTAVPPTPKAQKAAARGHAAGEYHYGRVSAVKDDKGNIKSYRVGPVPDPSGETYRGARQAALGHVQKMVKKLEPGRVTIQVYGRFGKSGTTAAELKKFRWVAGIFDRDDLMKSLQTYIDNGFSPEEAAQDLFDFENVPLLVLAWEGRQSAPLPTQIQNV